VIRFYSFRRRRRLSYSGGVAAGFFWWRGGGVLFFLYLSREGVGGGDRIPCSLLGIHSSARQDGALQTFGADPVRARRYVCGGQKAG